MRIKFCFLWEGLEFVKDIPREEGNMEPVKFVVPIYDPTPITPNYHSTVKGVASLVFEFEGWDYDSEGNVVPKFVFEGVEPPKETRTDPTGVIKND